MALHVQPARQIWLERLYRRREYVYKPLAVGISHRSRRGLRREVTGQTASGSAALEVERPSPTGSQERDAVGASLSVLEWPSICRYRARNPARDVYLHLMPLLCGVMQ